MGERLPAFLPRVAVLVLLALGATAGLTYAAGGGLTPSAAPSSAPVTQKPATIVVPDVRKEAFVFAKGQLQDAGFAWRISGSVHGFPSNTVVGQSPAPGTKLIDTGAPPVTLTLARNSQYPQSGAPEDVSPYGATPLRLADVAVAAAPAPKAKKKPVTAPTPTATTPAVTTTTPAATTPTATTTTPATTTTTPTTTAKPEAAAPRYPQNRPPAFVVPGARKEPLDEMPLPDRAVALGRWIATKPKPTNPNVKHWLFQNSWIVAGARLGWWRGAEALQTLVAVDARTDALWGIGAKSESVARQALAEVEARSR